MKAVLSGVAVGVLVFFGLLFAFASGTGPVELLLWLLVAIAGGVVTTRVTRRDASAKTTLS
jgi:hypothetical protein